MTILSREQLLDMASQLDSSSPYYAPLLISECLRLSDRVNRLESVLFEVAHHADDDSGFMVLVKKALEEVTR